MKKLREKALVRSEHFLAGMMICVNLEFPGFCCRLFKVPGLFEPTVTVIMLSPGVTGASRHLGLASESLLRSSRFLLDPNILSDYCVKSGESSGSVQPLAQFDLT